MIERLVPPDDPKKVTSWRWVVVIVIGALMLNGFAGRGMLFSGVGAYASEHVMQEQAVKIDKVLALQIATMLRDLKKDECVANGNKRALQAAIEDLQLDYVALTGRRYPLSCNVERA